MSTIVKITKYINMQKVVMTLLEIKNKYISGDISLLKATRMASKSKDELNAIYPENIPNNGKFYLYLNDHDVSIGYCDKSGKARTFDDMIAGFRQFCGNQNSCACNKAAKSEYWNSLSDEKIELINLRRKKTVQEKYGVDSVSQLEENKKKAELTCYARYGTKSPTQNPDILKKSSKTCMINNGVSWPQQNPEILAKTNVTFVERYGVTRPAKYILFQEKAQQTCMDRYGVPFIMQHSEISKKVTSAGKRSQFQTFLLSRTTITPLFTIDDYANSESTDLLLWKCNKCENEFFQQFRLSDDNSCPDCNPKTMTWGEILIDEWLKELEIDYEKGSYKIIPPHQLDFYIPSINVAIEFNGLYWHSELAGRNKTYHVNKFKKCDELGIKLIQIFEHELIYKPELIKHRILSALGKSTNRIYARKLKTKQISSKIARKFLNDNHLHASTSASFNYALVDDNDIVYSVMTFSKSRFSKSAASWELVRFASLAGYTVVGAASKLFASFVRDNEIDSVVSYADLNWGKGNVYTNLGFVFSHYSSPNYWYFQGIDSVTSRMKFQKHKLPKELYHLGSEWEIMKYLKWNRYWDSGNAVWIWKK